MSLLKPLILPNIAVKLGDMNRVSSERRREGKKSEQRGEEINQEQKKVISILIHSSYVNCKKSRSLNGHGDRSTVHTRARSSLTPRRSSSLSVTSALTLQSEAEEAGSFSDLISVDWFRSV